MSLLADALTVRGKPRDVGNGRCFEDMPDGTVVYVVHRCDTGFPPSGLELRFPGADDLEALQGYEEYCAERYDIVHRRAERMGRWGPRGTGKMA